jgi:hypothetical protein
LFLTLHSQFFSNSNHCSVTLCFCKPFTLRVYKRQTISLVFNFHGSVHRNNYSDIYPTRCKFTQFILSGNCSTCFGWYLQPSSGAHTPVSTASGICHTVTAICRCRGRVGTGLSVLWVAYAICHIFLIRF